jgi:hypothetical protein
MAYTPNIKLEAENLYLRGHNLNQITEQLKKKHPKITHTTISKWATKKDKSGKTWDDYKNEIITTARQISHQTAKNRYAVIKEKALIIQEGLERTLLSGNLEIKSPENAIYAWKGLNEFILMIEDKYESKKTPKEIVVEFLDVLNSVPQIMNPIKKHWNLVEDELKRRIEEDWK